MSTSELITLRMPFARTLDVDPSCLDDRIRLAGVAGHCHSFAQALHLRTGWPIMCATDDDGDATHLGCLNPDGDVVDICGLWEIEDWVSQWGVDSERLSVDIEDLVLHHFVQPRPDAFAQVVIPLLEQIKEGIDYHHMAEDTSGVGALAEHSQSMWVHTGQDADGEHQWAEISLHQWSDEHERVFGLGGAQEIGWAYRLVHDNARQALCVVDSRGDVVHAVAVAADGTLLAPGDIHRQEGLREQLELAALDIAGEIVTLNARELGIKIDRISERISPQVWLPLEDLKPSFATFYQLDSEQFTRSRPQLSDARPKLPAPASASPNPSMDR